MLIKYTLHKRQTLFNLSSSRNFLLINNQRAIEKFFPVRKILKKYITIMRKNATLKVINSCLACG